MLKFLNLSDYAYFLILILGLFLRDSGHGRQASAKGLNNPRAAPLFRASKNSSYLSWWQERTVRRKNPFAFVYG